MLRTLFPSGRFALPPSDSEIAAVEAALGVALPEPLHRLYLECDGFREDRGNAKYLLSLTDEDTIGSLLSVTRYFWNGWAATDLKPFLFFGCSSGDEWWGINWSKPEEIIAYHPGMGAEYEAAGSDILELYRADYALYEAVGEVT